MADELSSVNSYGRKTWNKNEYIKKAKDRYKEDDATEVVKKDITKRNVTYDFKANLNQKQIVSQLTLVSVHRGKSSGFYCQLCNLTFKDNLTFLNHINSTQHLDKSEFKTGNLNRKITVQDIKEKLEQVHQAKIRQAEKDNEMLVFDLRKRVADREKFNADQRTKKKHQRQLKRAKIAPTSEASRDIMAQMGFSDFTSK